MTSFLPRLRGTGTHRADDRIAELTEQYEKQLANLRQENVALLNRQAAADDFFLEQDHYLTQLEADLAEEKTARAEAEDAARDLRREMEGWRDEALRLRARFAPQLAADANAHRVDVPPAIRDTTDPADQATTPIDVKPLWQALGIGPITVIDNPNATDPARITH